MFRLLLPLLFFPLLLAGEWQQVSSADYKVGYGFLDKLGVATARLYREGERYRITVHAKATGFAAFLSGGREEFYESRGTVEEGRYVPAVYQHLRKQGGGSDETTFRFDHEEKNVTVHRLRCEGKKCRKNQKFHDFYAADDLLTLYFNLDGYTREARPGETFRFPAVGPKEGIVDLVFPEGKERKELEESLGEEGGKALIAIVHQKIFSSEKGELLMHLDSDGVCTKALLKNVILFGDVHGTLTGKNVTPLP